jgi:hypothetical protein
MRTADLRATSVVEHVSGKANAASIGIINGQKKKAIKVVAPGRSFNRRT